MLAIPNCKEMEEAWVYNRRSLVNNYESEPKAVRITNQNESIKRTETESVQCLEMVGNGNANKHKQTMHKCNNAKEYKRIKPSLNRIQYTYSIQQEDSIQSDSTSIHIYT